jgi:hypothetical protein
MRWSQADRTLLTLADSTMTPGATSEVAAHHVSGVRTLRLVPGQFDLRLTHDLDRWGDYTYLLGEQRDGVGGLEVFQGNVKIGQWLLTDAFAGGNLGFAHVNGLSVASDGEIVLSALNFDVLIGIDGDPASPTFLQKRWHANGTPSGDDLPNPDYVGVPGTGFDGQHHGSRHGDELWVFDNRGDRVASRALRMAMDPANGTLTELDSWSVGGICANQGGAIPLPGGALVTCANQDRVFAFRDGAATADWRLQAQCGPPGGGSSTRAYPVTIE